MASDDYVKAAVVIEQQLRATGARARQESELLAARPPGAPAASARARLAHVLAGRARPAHTHARACADDPAPMLIALRQMVDEMAYGQIPAEPALVISRTCLPKCITLLLKYRHVLEA